MTAKDIPLQSNFCDCGLYLLGYMDKFLEHPRRLIYQLLQREPQDWPKMNPSDMRNEIRDLLLSLYEDQQRDLKAARKDQAKREGKYHEKKGETKPDNPQLETKLDNPRLGPEPDSPQLEARPNSPQLEAKLSKPQLEAKPDTPQLEAKSDNPPSETQPDDPGNSQLGVKTDYPELRTPGSTDSSELICHVATENVSRPAPVQTSADDVSEPQNLGKTLETA